LRYNIKYKSLVLGLKLFIENDKLMLVRTNMTERKLIGDEICVSEYRG